MPQRTTSQVIIISAKRLFALRGYSGVSMRLLAAQSGASLSSIYHHFEDKDVLLTEIYKQTNARLGLARRCLPDQPTAEEMLVDRVNFQFDHIEDIVFVLKYYMHYRQEFAALPTKSLPPKSTLHIEEVLYKGLSTGEFAIPSHLVAARARIITHMINGFLLEYYPDVPMGNERKKLVQEIVEFSMPALV